MEKEFIDNALKVMKFNIEDKEKPLVQFVAMREYGVATQEKPLLLTAGLQSCIALIAYSKKFSFLAHMNMYRGNWNDDFDIDEESGTGKCKKVEDLYSEILANKQNISEPINIGPVLGVTPLERDYTSRKVLEKDLLGLFSKLRENNIYAIRMPDINSFSFILDSRTGEILHDGVENQNKVTKIAQYGNKKYEKDINNVQEFI